MPPKVPGTVICAASVIALMCAGCQSSGSSQLAQLRQENSRLRAEVAQLRAQLSGSPNGHSAGTVASGSKAQPSITDKGELIETRRIVFKSDYDADANVTVLSSLRQALTVTEGSRKKHLVTLVYEYHGKDAAKPTGPILMEIDVRFHGPHYHNTKQFMFHLGNGTTVSCPISNYKAIRRTSGIRSRTRHDDEFVTVSIPVATLAKIATAQHLTGTLGRTKVRFSVEQVAMFKALDRKRQASGTSNKTP